MDSARNPIPRRNLTGLFWWTVLTSLVFGLPQLSPLVAASIGWFSLGNGVNPTAEMLVSYATLGASTGLTLCSNLVVFAALLLGGGNRWKRLLIGIGYLLVYLFVSLGVFFVMYPNWVGYISLNREDFQQLLGVLFLPPSLSIASIVPAAVMQFSFGWTIHRGPVDRTVRRIDLPTLLEWVLVSAVFFAFLRTSSALKYQSSAQVLAYEMVVVVLPAIALGVITLVFMHWMLGFSSAWRAPRALAMAVAINAAVYGTAVVGFGRIDRPLSLRLNLVSAAAPLATSLLGTVCIAGIVGCMKQLGFRLRTRHETHGSREA